jgi:prepilin-type processing-associated H-X9-DG protein
MNSRNTSSLLSTVAKHYFWLVTSIALACFAPSVAAQVSGTASVRRPLPPCRGSLSLNWTNGIGTWTGPTTGTTYVGEWKDDKHNRQGTITMPNGTTYVGEWRDGNFYELGTFTTNNATYVGEWKDGNFYGQGTFTFADGAKYVGEWKDGRHNGQGTFAFADGAKYVGEFKDGRQNGNGTEYRPNGSILRSGVWENGNFITSR